MTAAPTKWVCIHGHFYQPPRENPWLEAVEPQPSAHPYRDWNHRITAECYRPNAAARIVDGAGQIIRITDNYERMSFNFGPTLMSWLEDHAPDVHAAVIEADRASAKRFGGHGSAMAQAYNHMIMPLASLRDQRTQVRWGIADFEYRFGRKPEGMWLPECAVNTKSLEALAAEGILFTVLAPHQASAWRPKGGQWRTTPIDPGRVYRVDLPSGRSIDVYFYDGATSRAVAFERLLVDGQQIIQRMTNRGPAEGDAPLCHIATDGETYGHHHRYGDMSLAWALSQVEHGWNGTRLTTYAEYRTLVPATWEALIVEDSSWSCAHGIERWRADCGCNSGGRPGWNQQWRGPLREALDWLRDRAAKALDGVGKLLFRDPWEARDAYVRVILERTQEARDAFLSAHGAHRLDHQERVRALSLMEMARHAMLAYTSCGWFFDDLAGIETVQCMQYAARAAELLEAVGGDAVEAELVERLALGRSNLVEEGDGRQVWQRRVQPGRIEAPQVAAHVAVSTLVEPAAAPCHEVFGFRVALIDRIERKSGRTRMVAGIARVFSTFTEHTQDVCFAGLHLGEQHVTGGVRAPFGAAQWAAVVDDLTNALDTADIFAAQRVIDRHFPGASLSLSALMPVDRDRVIESVLGEAIASAEEELAHAYDSHAPLVRWLVAHHLSVPDVLHKTAEATLQRRVLANLRSAEPSFQLLRDQLAEAAHVQVSLDTPEIALAASEALRRVLDRLGVSGGAIDPAALEAAARAAEVAARMKSGVDLWFAQNATWRLLRRRAELRDPSALASLERLAAALRIMVPKA